uniref:Reverse transcriptase domain-containing protein n=1 Tax=Haemonchus placei TaxID=6290 RepID=A0A0N4VS59_HAEPC
LKRFLGYKIRRASAPKNIRNLALMVSKYTKFIPPNPIIIKDDGTKISDDASKVEAFADYFSGVFRSRTNATEVSTSSSSLLSIPLVTSNAVDKHLATLKPSLSPTADNIPQYFFKHFRGALATPLAHIFNLSLLTGQVPTIWKTALVTPIPKVCNASKISDFRPIRVPQGGILSPLLFLIYTNDLLARLKTHPSVRVAAFADDIKVYATYTFQDKEIVQTALNESCPEYGHLASCDLVRDLGVTITRGLKWKLHVDNVYNKAMRVMHSLFRNIHCSDILVWIKLFKMTSRWICKLPQSVSASKTSESFKRALKKIDVLQAIGVEDVA